MVEFCSDFRVDEIQHCGSDIVIAAAAKTSVNAEKALSEPKIDGLLRTLMDMKHGTPFEHNVMTFSIDAPIMVWREFHRHRIGFSYNEQSGRYSKMRPKFYIPPAHRPMKPVEGFKPMRPEFEPLGEFEYNEMIGTMKGIHAAAWDQYEYLLTLGVAKEVARSVLGVGIYSTCWVTCNARSMMHFLSLRVKSKKTYPQWEINQVALKMEAMFAEWFPRAYRYYLEVGREAP